MYESVNKLGLIDGLVSWPGSRNYRHLNGTHLNVQSTCQLLCFPQTGWLNTAQKCILFHVILLQSVLTDAQSRLGLRWISQSPVSKQNENTTLLLKQVYSTDAF